MIVGQGQHVAVACFESIEGPLEQREVLDGAPPRQAGEDVVGAEEEAAFREVVRERLEIVAAQLDLDVVAILDVVDAHVKLGPAGQSARDFLAKEEIRVRPQRFHGVDGIVVGNGDKVHAKPLQLLVNGCRFVIALAADRPQNRDGTHTGVRGVDVQIAPHSPFVEGERLQFDYTREKHPLTMMFFATEDLPHATIGSDEAAGLPVLRRGRRPSRGSQCAAAGYGAGGKLRNPPGESAGSAGFHRRVPETHRLTAAGPV